MNRRVLLAQTTHPAQKQVRLLGAVPRILRQQTRQEYGQLIQHEKHAGLVFGAHLQ